MVEFNFKSQRATTIEQSERLIALGLKKETADMIHQSIGTTPFNAWYKQEIEDDLYPAWSLHRLIEMMPMSLVEDKVYHEYWDLNVTPIAVIYRSPDDPSEWIGERMGRGMYNNIIDCIAWLIKEGHFNKEYLV